MKKLMFLIISLVILSFVAFAQIKVNSTGKVGITMNTDAGYDLSLKSIIFKEGYISTNLIIGNDPTSSGFRAIYLSQNGFCEVGLYNKQFANIYATRHYVNTVLLTSDKRLKENFRSIEKPLDKLLLMSGQKYDFINQRTDTVKNEKLKDLRFEKDRLGFIAQDLEKILPEAVYYAVDEDRYYIDYNAVIPVIVEAMKEQQTQIEVLKEEVVNCCKANLKNASLVNETTNNLAENVAQLDQNIPNPFSKETKVGCFIPEGSVLQFCISIT